MGAQITIQAGMGAGSGFPDEAYEAAVRGYQIGRFDLTSTVIARAALLNVRLSYIDANRALWAEDLRLRALTGSAPFNGDF